VGLICTAVPDFDLQDLLFEVLGELRVLLGVLRGHWIDIEPALQSPVQDLLKGRPSLREQPHLLLLDQQVLLGELDLCVLLRLNPIFNLLRQPQMHRLRLH